MPITASQALRPASPATLDEASSVRQDKIYRRYASNVERALSVFDTALQEWADYIAFLGRLLKALQSKPPGTTDVPHKTFVAKRLAQCLNAMLPSGVHQKALEVYACVFSILNKDGLSRDLPLYLPGLAPTLSFASLAVKPNLLSLFEKFIVPLNPDILRSALKSLVLALLPGMEEETSEEFERTHSLLNIFRDRVTKELGQKNGAPENSGDQNFWQSLFLASITSSSRRQGALAYLCRELPVLGTPVKSLLEPHVMGTGTSSPIRQLPPNIEAMTSPEPGLLIRCFASGLQDEQLLIQRGFLDLLVSHLPLHADVLRQKVTSRDLELLVAAAANVVARREMSLNRRLWTWFLGPGVSASLDDDSPSTPQADSIATVPKAHNPKMSQTEYFERYGLTPLVNSVLSMVTNDSSAPAERARPFRICLSLMDRWEIGGLVVPRIFLPAMRSVWRYQTTASSKEALEEVLRSAKVFFGAVESNLIWAELGRVLIGALSDTNANADEVLSSDPQQSLDLVLFIINNFDVREEDMLVLHIPMVTLALLISLRQRLEVCLTADEHEAPQVVETALIIAVQLLDLLPAKTLNTSKQMMLNSDEAEPLKGNNPHTLQRIQDFYQELQRRPAGAIPPFQVEEVRQLLLQNSFEIVTQELSYSIRVKYLEKEILFLDKFIRKAQITDLQGSASSEHDGMKTIMSNLVRATDEIAFDKTSNFPFPVAAALVSAVETMSNALSSRTWNSNYRVRKILTNLLASLWVHISPSQPKNNVEAVRCLWRIHLVSPDSRLVEGSVATLMLKGQPGQRHQGIGIEGARHFTTLWAHSGSTFKSSTNNPSASGNTTRKSDHRGTTSDDEPMVLARPLLLLLDTLSDSNTELFVFTASWLQSLSSIQQITEFLIFHLEQSPYLAIRGRLNAQANNPSMLDKNCTLRDNEKCLYYLQKILNLATHSPVNFGASLTDKVRSVDRAKSQQIADHDPSGQVTIAVEDQEQAMTTQIYLTDKCLSILEEHRLEEGKSCHRVSVLCQTSVALLQQIFHRPSSATTLAMNLDQSLIQTLSWSIEQSDHMLQLSLMDLLMTVLGTQMTRNDAIPTPQRRPTSRETIRSASQLSLSTEKSDKDHVPAGQSTPTPDLLDCLMSGISSTSNHPILEHWIRFLDNCLPFYANYVFQILIPLIDCFKRSIELVFQGLRNLFEDTPSGLSSLSEPITILNTLCNGLEHVLTRGHDQLVQDESLTASLKSPEQIQGFFGNMVSGVFASEAQKSRSITANNRLTVLLCFKDAVRVSFTMWSWGNAGPANSPRDATHSASFNYTSLRLRNRTRRTLEQLFAAEALECLETLVEFWHKADSANIIGRSASVFNLMHALDGARPKNTIPALFNAIYSRTNPSVLDSVRKSSLTSELSDVSLATFLVAYTRSMEDDALDEIWAYCMTFLKDVLGNPMPHRQILPLLLEFTAVLGEKIDNTNFGEQRKMRRDIGDLFVRLLAATFTIRSLAISQEHHISAYDEKVSRGLPNITDSRKGSAPDDVIAIIASILPRISKILVDTDRITAATTTISINVIGPTFRGKTFPRNFTQSMLDILKTMSRIPEASKTWRKDITEAFNDPRFFHTGSLDLVQHGWMPLLRQWTLVDKDRMPDLLSRLSSPTSAGIMFGVGATSARLEADRKAQLNLRRIAVLILSADNDAFITSISSLQDKLIDLMAATPASSPSSITRADIYMVVRALILRTSPVHLATLWPIINNELYDALSSLYPMDRSGTYDDSSLLQSAKLLDTLLTISSDDFQLREWLFVTDTIEAVYKPLDWRPIALVDGLAEALDSKAGVPHSGAAQLVSPQQGKRRPLLTTRVTKGVPRESLVDRVLHPFLRQLSINSFESTYRMEVPDWRACSNDLIEDLFDDSTLV